MSILNRLFGSKANKTTLPKGARSAPMVRDLLLARTAPWNRVAPIVIATILEAITDKGLLEAFVMHSMNEGLVARYETIGQGGDSPEVIRAQISHILCQTGNRAVPALSKALTVNQRDAAHKAMMLAGDAFKAAIALAKNQISAYAGLAAIYSIVGKTAEAQRYATLGLSELKETRRGPLGRALRDGSCTVFPADMLDQAEQQLRSYL